MRHGAKMKRCNRKGCAKGVCTSNMGQTVIFYDESTAFGNSQASAYEETTANISNRRTSAASRGKDTAGNGVPPQVIFCQVTKEV